MQRVGQNQNYETQNYKNTINKKTRPSSEYRSLYNLQKNKTSSTFPKINKNLQVSI